MWKGSLDANGGHYLVSWAKVKRPKNLGGLGVLDLELFSRALRLRWLWFEWTEPDRPWVGTNVPCDEVDKQLFRACTRVSVGDGAKAKFWDSTWVQGRAPRDLAPNLYKLAWRKNLTVREELQNHNWTRGLWRMSSALEMAEFVMLWNLVQDTQLSMQQDEIRWCWTADGQYTAQSAYKAQFCGSYCTFDSHAIWKAKVEDKHRFFAWLLVQCKLLTADKLIKRNWPCNPICPLCDQLEETAEHMCLHCVFAQEVWLLVSNWTEGQVKLPVPGTTIQEWWNNSMQGLGKKDKQRMAALMIYTSWNVWKERNRRIFQGVAVLPSRILALIKEEMKLRELACGRRQSNLVS